MSKLFEKLIALILVIILIGANLILLGEYTISYATDEKELNKQTTKTNHKNIEFNSYFYGGSHNQIFEVNSDDAKIYLDIKINNTGYLENGTVEFQNVNFKIKDGIKNDNIQSIDSKNNKITLKKLNGNSNITIELPIEILNKDTIPVDYFSKETITKFTGKYIDGNGKEHDIEKEVSNKISWKVTAEVELKSEITKYIPYNIGDNYGIMLQAKINSKVKDNSLPIKDTNIEITVPIINNVKPANVNVIATKTEATNGKSNGLEFTNANYTYDEQSNKITINTENTVDENNNVVWKKNATDEYLVTYLFEGKEIYDFVNVNGINSKITIDAKLNVYNNEETIINLSNELDIKNKEILGQVANFEIVSPQDISKGYMYSNYDAKTKLETEYNTKYIATIDSTKLIQSLEFIQSDDKFLDKYRKQNSTTIGTQNYAYNKKVKISQSIFNKILGEDGVITLKDEKGIELGKINKESTLENGKYIIDISSKNSNKLDIYTTAPISEGQLEIEIIKAVKGEIDYSKEQVQSFEKIKQEVIGKTNMSEMAVTSETLLKEPELKAELEIDKTDWSTAIKNENIELKAILDTSNEYNALFKNPTIQIEFPEVVEKIEVKNIKLLYTDELKIKEAKFNKANDKFVLNITMEGTQTVYSIGQAIRGINIVINADITLKQMIPTQETEVKMYYMNNDNGISTYSTDSNQELKESVVKVNAISQTGIVTESGIYSIRNNTNISSIEDEKVQGIIDTYSQKRTATVYGKIVNSYSNPINDLIILGRVPAEGNKKIDADEDLGSNLNLIMKNQLSIVGLEEADCKIYYSENINATKDLGESSNRWTTTPSNLANVKSYMIVTSNYEILQGEEIEFQYEVEIPENLEHEKSSYQMYKVYYNNVTEVGTLAETKESPIVGVTTGEEPKLEVQLSSSFEQNAEVREEQIVKFLATIKNTGGAKAERVVLHITAPDGTTHTIQDNNGYEYIDSEEKDRKINVGDIEAGATEEVYFELKFTDDIKDRVKVEWNNYVQEQLAQDPNADAGELLEQAKAIYTEETYKADITFHVGVTTTELKTQKISNDYTLKKTKGSIIMITTPSKLQSATLKPGDKIQVFTKITCVNYEPIKNVVITSNIPQGITIENVYLEKDEVKDTNNVKVENNKITATIPELTKEDGTIYLLYDIIIGEFNGKLQTLLTATGDGMTTQYSNEAIHNVENIKLEITQTSSTPQYVLEGNNIVYNFVIKNTGKVQASNVVIENKIPDGLEFVNAKYEYNNTSNAISSNSDDILNIFLYGFSAGATCNITVTLKAKTLYTDEIKEVTNFATVKVNGINNIESNKITNYIEYDPEQHVPEDGESTQRKYSISGVAWEDANKNGQREEDEKLLSGIQVYLLKKSNGSIVKDPNTGSENITTTDNSGKYQFANLPKGQYLVVFAYESAKYNITQYQAKDVNESLNSDAISTKIKLEGEERLAGITDTINISNRHVRNVDIGLYVSEKFDLRLDKYVNKITLTTPTIGTRTYNYNDSQLAKIEVLSQNLGQSSIVIEYKFVIRNEGAIAGYAKKLVDYLPENAKFNAELNTDWYLSDDGNAYNASLANIKINPGETKEVTLVLTKQIDEIEIINNMAEIYESYNEQGLEDMDSVAGNQSETEDDTSKANVVISLVTGKIIMYTSIALIVIAMLGFGIYEIKKRVLNKRR